MSNQMKKKKSVVVLLCIIYFCSLGCNGNKANSPVAKTHVDSYKSNINVPNIDDDFNVFIELFSKDSMFQISRIDFPLKVHESNLQKDYELSEKIIKKSVYRKRNFSYKIAESNIDTYSQEIKVINDKATIEIRGNENGLMIDIFFEKQKGKWKLITWTDSST
jgi:hypothetical protein